MQPLNWDTTHESVRRLVASVQQKFHGQTSFTCASLNTCRGRLSVHQSGWWRSWWTSWWLSGLKLSSSHFSIPWTSSRSPPVSSFVLFTLSVYYSAFHPARILISSTDGRNVLLKTLQLINSVWVKEWETGGGGGGWKRASVRGEELQQWVSQDVPACLGVDVSFPCGGITKSDRLGLIIFLRLISDI